MHLDRHRLAAGLLWVGICLVGLVSCDTPPRSAPPPLPSPVPVAAAEPAPDLLAEGIAEADAWAHAGSPANAESVVPVSRGRRCYHCGRPWYRAAAERPTDFARALAERNDPRLAFVTAENVVLEYGEIAAVDFVRALDAQERLWEEGMRALSECPTFFDFGLLAHAIRRHVEAHPGEPSLPGSVLSFSASIVAHARLHRYDDGKISPDLLHPTRFFKRRLTSSDFTRALDRPRAWLDVGVWCPSFASEPGVSAQLVTLTRERAEKNDPDLVVGSRSVLACLCARHAEGAKQQLATFFRGRTHDPMSVDGELAAAFEHSCR